MRNVFFEMGAEEQTDSLDEEEVDIVMEIVEVKERGSKDKLPALRNVPKKKLLEETSNVDKVLISLKLIVLQRLRYCSMQELFLLLQID